MFIVRDILADRIAHWQPHFTTLAGFLVLFAIANRVSAQCTALLGDANGDRRVDLEDYSIFADCLAGPGIEPSPDPPTTTQACLDAFDLDDDGDVDLFDFAEVLANYTGLIRHDCYNVVFVSSASFATNLGSPTAYDAQCNQLATAAGLNNPANNAFIAWVTDANSNARTRLGATVRGFVRVDGVAFADSQTSLFSNNAVFNPIGIDEYGNDVGAAAVMTGTNADGTTAIQNCTNWTGGGFAMIGSSAGGPGAWTATGAVPCQGTFRIHCVEKTKNIALAPPPSSGKRIYLTASTFVPGSTTPDQLCDAEKPPGVGTVRALVARTMSSASALLNPQALFVRVDGQVVGTGVEIAALTNLRSGIWQTGSGVYVPSSATTLVWTGHTNLSGVGTVQSTCDNWTVPVSTAGRAGYWSTTQSPNWWNIGTRDCHNPYRLYCFEQ